MRTLLLMLLFSFFASAQKSEKGKIYNLKGVLKSETERYIACGNIAIAYAFEFDIVDFTDEKYRKKSIVVIVACPDFYDDSFFETRRFYYLEILKEKPEMHYVISDEEALLKKYGADKIYWAVKINRIKTDW